MCHKIWGRFPRRNHISCISNFKIFYFQILLILSLLALITCAVHQFIKIIFKVILLLTIFLLFLICVGILLMLSYKTCQMWFLNTERFFIDLIFVVFFLVGQIIHSQQSEVTRRLDFIWKLQATGWMIFRFQLYIIISVEHPQFQRKRKTWRIFKRTIESFWPTSSPSMLPTIS